MHLTAMFSFAEGSTFLATTAGSLAGLIGGLSLQCEYSKVIRGSLRLFV